MFDDQDRFPIPIMKDAVYEFELVRRRVADPVITGRGGPEKLAEWAMRVFAGITDQRLLVVAIDHDTKVLGYEVVMRGPAVTETTLADSGVLRTIIQLGIRRFAVVQLTPGFDQPDLTESDEEFIRHLGRSAGTLGLEMLDFIVVAERGWLSARARAAQAADNDPVLGEIRGHVSEAFDIPVEDLILFENEADKTEVMKKILIATGLDPSVVDGIGSMEEAFDLYSSIVERVKDNPELARRAAEAAEQAVRDQIRKAKDVDDESFRTLEDLMGGTPTVDEWGPDDPPINELPA